MFCHLIFSLVTQSASSDLESNSPCHTPTLKVMNGFKVALINSYLIN